MNLAKRKATAVMTMPAVVNMLEAIDSCQNNAAKFHHSFLLMIGSDDTVVSNRGAL